MQDKENSVELRRVQEEQEKQLVIEQQQQAQLQVLAQKASAINDDIIRLSKDQDYEGMKVKFSELENTVNVLTTLKDEMNKAKDHQEREKQLVQESIAHRDQVIKDQEQEDKQIHAYNDQGLKKETLPILSNQPSDVEIYKNREIVQEQNVLFSEAVDRYENKKYTQAKLLFGELADQHDRRAEVWLKKVDRAITRELLRSQEGEERERTAFIEDQLKAQRQLEAIQVRERERQKRLSEELERQKRIYEDDQLLQIQKEQTMKAQVRERERQEQKRRRLEESNEKQQENYRFHRIPVAAKPPSSSAIGGNSGAIASEAKPSLNAQKMAAPSSAPGNEIKIQPQAKPVAVPPAMNAAQLKAQIDFSNKRKAYLDSKFKKELKEQERQARIKAAADARQKRIEEKEKERERQKELKAQQAQAKADALVQEKKHREEFLREQAQEREEKIKQEEIVREETKRQQEMEQQERQRQAELEIQREAVRKQLEQGVEAMYQEALGMYNQGNFTAAADKFKDIQDILPGYKHSEQYMDESRQKSMVIETPQVLINSPSAQETNTTTPPPAASPVSTPVSHQDDVSKALDLFDPNAK